MTTRYHFGVRTITRRLVVALIPLAVIVLGVPLVESAVRAQTQPDEAEIRRLEQLEVRAIVARDTATLRTLWDAAYVVNNPDNLVVDAKPDPTDRPVMQKARIAMTRTPEKITFRSDFAIAMGSETIVPGEGQPSTGQTVTRRYTNIWMKQSGGWKLVARHANIVCP